MKSPAVFVLLPCELVNVETVQISAFCGYWSSQDVQLYLRLSNELSFLRSLSKRPELVSIY